MLAPIVLGYGCIRHIRSVTHGDVMTVPFQKELALDAGDYTLWRVDDGRGADGRCGFSDGTKLEPTTTDVRLAWRNRRVVNVADFAIAKATRITLACEANAPVQLIIHPRFAYRWLALGWLLALLGALQGNRVWRRQRALRRGRATVNATQIGRL